MLQASSPYLVWRVACACVGEARFALTPVTVISSNLRLDPMILNNSYLVNLKQEMNKKKHT